MDLGMTMQVIIMACGVYMIYWAVQMKTSKKIPQMLVGKGFKLEKAKNPDGFIKSTFPFTFATGVIIFLGGACNAIELFAMYPVIDYLISLVIVIVIIAYGAFLSKAQKKYLLDIKIKEKDGKKHD